MTDTNRRKRSKHPGVHRKAPGRGWVFRWREIDPRTGAVRKVTSPEYASLEAALIEYGKHKADERERKTARKGVRGALPLERVLARWRESRLTMKAAGEAYVEDVVRSLSALAKQRRWWTVEQITADEVDQWITEKHGRGTARPLAHIKSVLGFAWRVMRQPIDAHVLVMTHQPATVPTPPRCLTDDELARVFAKADSYGENVGALVRHVAMFGQRPRTVVAMKVGDYDEAGRVLTIWHNKNRRGFQHLVHDEDHARRLSRLCAGRESDEALFLAPPWQRGDGKVFPASPWSGRHGSAARLSVWYQRHIDRGGIYHLVDTAVSRMRAAGWDAATIESYTGKRTARVQDLYDATTRHRQRQLWIRLPLLPAAAIEDGGQDGGTTPAAVPDRVSAAVSGATILTPTAT